MNLRQLEIFIAVVECGLVTKAAEKLFISQPSVSLAIAEMERQYDVRLFERLNKRLVLTSIGRTLFDQAKIAVKNFNDIDGLLSDYSKVNAIKIGATVTIGNYFLPNILDGLSKRKEYLFEKVIVDNTERIISKILDGELDFAIIEGNCDNENVIKKVYCDDEIVFVASKNYRIDGGLIENFIVREKGSGTREVALERMNKMNINVKNLWEMSSTEAIKNMVKSGRAATAISSKLVEKELQSGEMIVILKEKIKRKFFLIYHKDNNMQGRSSILSDIYDQ